MRGVKGLMIAVLEEAIVSLSARTAGSSKQRLRRAAAMRWLRSEDRSHPFAFESICDALSIDADRVRRQVLEGDALGMPRARVERRVETQMPRIKAPTKRIRIRNRARQRAAS